ncbi:MAG: YggS family pyridoxal phosphate-dependent enzyme [Candidatus Binataceae bacterium]
MEQEELKRRLDAVRDRIAAAARRSGRTPDMVRLVLASKTQPAAAVRAAYGAGARDFGENYVQEALAKQTELADLKDIRWHLIGHLQTNKARVAAGAFDLIHSLDSVRLGAALSRCQPKAPQPANARVAVLLEVNLGEETSKTGVSPADTEPLIRSLIGKVDVQGLMAIPPPGPGPEHSRSYFVQLRDLRDRVAAATGLALSELSMGMTDDFEIAIEEGATIVRVGRAVFGERPR